MARIESQNPRIKTMFDHDFVINIFVDANFLIHRAKYDYMLSKLCMQCELVPCSTNRSCLMRKGAVTLIFIQSPLKRDLINFVCVVEQNGSLYQFTTHNARPMNAYLPHKDRDVRTVQPSVSHYQQHKISLLLLAP